MKKRKIQGIIAAALGTLLIITGCGNKSKIETGASTQSETTIASTQSETKIVSTIKGDVSIPTNPKRIADISGSSEELLILGQTLVATANTDPYNREDFTSYIKDRMENVKIVGFSMAETMDVEAILEVEPDLIIMSQKQEKVYDLLKDIAPVVMLKEYDNDWRTKMTDIASLFDQGSKVEEWLKAYDIKAQGIAKQTIEKNGTQTYLTTLVSGGKIYIFSDAGIGAILYNDMKLDKPANLPIQEGISLPVVTMEGLSEIDADHIVVIATDEDKADLESSSVWNNIRAVKEGNVTLFESSPYFGQGYNPIGRELLLDVIEDRIIKK